MGKAVEGDPKIDINVLNFVKEIRSLSDGFVKMFPNPQILASNLDSKTLRKVNLDIKQIRNTLDRYTAHFDNYHSIRIEQSSKSQINKMKNLLKQSGIHVFKNRELE